MHIYDFTEEGGEKHITLGDFREKEATSFSAKDSSLVAGEGVVGSQEDLFVEDSLFFLVGSIPTAIYVDVVGSYRRVKCACIVLSGECSLQLFLGASYTAADVYMVSFLQKHSQESVSGMKEVTHTEKLSLNGKIEIASNVVKTEGLLYEEVLLLPSMGSLCEGAPVQVKMSPVLDIRSNDVRASHGGSIHSLPDNALFYLQAKGVTAQEASRLLIESYIVRAIHHCNPGQTVKEHPFFDKILQNLQKNSL